MKKILLVDDEFMIARIMKRHLESEGFSVCTVAGVRDAEVAVEINEHFDLAIIDLRLPNGLPTQIVNWVKAKWPGIPVIFVSGAPDDAYPLVLMKPWTLEEILNRVKKEIGEP